MKSLSTYLEERFNLLFTKYNAFFAFSKEQFEKQKKDNIEYVSRGAGLYHEVGKSKEFDADYQLAVKEAIEQDLKENGREAIIERELQNYECYYTYDINEAVIKLSDYGITYDEVKAIFNKNKHKN